MSRRVTLELPDEILDRAERLASLANRDVAEVLADAVSAALPPLDVTVSGGRPISQLSDDAVLKLADLQLSVDEDSRLSRLLDQQQAGTLSDADRTELLTLIQVYEVRWLRQAEALAEAVRRGLREPLSS